MEYHLILSHNDLDNGFELHQKEVRFAIFIDLTEPNLDYEYNATYNNIIKALAYDKNKRKVAIYTYRRKLKFQLNEFSGEEVKLKKYIKEMPNFDLENEVNLTSDQAITKFCKEIATQNTEFKIKLFFVVNNPKFELLDSNTLGVKLAEEGIFQACEFYFFVREDAANDMIKRFCIMIDGEYAQFDDEYALNQLIYNKLKKEKSLISV